MRAVSSARANATSRRLAPPLPGCVSAQFSRQLLLPASFTHQHVAGSRMNIGQGDPFIAQDEFAHLVGKCCIPRDLTMLSARFRSPAWLMFVR